MIIGKDSTYEEQIPHEPGQTFTFRYLTGSEMEMAEARKSAQAMELFKSLPPEAIAAVMAAGRAQDEEKKDPYGQHDITLVLNSGIRAWTYGEVVQEDSINMLDGKTRMWAFRHLIDKNTVSEDLGEDSDS